MSGFEPPAQNPDVGIHTTGDNVTFLPVNSSSNLVPCVKPQNIFSILGAN